MSDDEQARARRYLAEGDPAMALGVCEAALRDARPADALSLRLVAARASAESGDLQAQVRHLEAAEALARPAGPDALGPVLAQLGAALLARGEAGPAGAKLDLALELLPRGEPASKRARALRDEAREREAAEIDDAPAAIGVGHGGQSKAARASHTAAGAQGTERILSMVDRLLEGDADLPLGEVLDSVLAELVQAIEADRGFVLLREPGEGLAVRAARDAKGQPIQDPASQVSRKIAERAAAEQVALRAVRPDEDPRFAGSRSVKALELRAVVAAPLRYRKIDLGCVVLDRRGAKDVAFDDAAEALVDRFARLASGVIVRTRRREAQKRRADALQSLFTRGAAAREQLSTEGLVGESEPIVQLLKVLERIAPTEARVLIRGESGTGKELVAKTVHANSGRRAGPFQAVNCAALPESLLEDELFGHVKGAYSGADGDRPGLFERGTGGTVFLDEIGDASPRLQAELLRVLQEGEVRRLGENKLRKVDVRVVAATHKDLEAMVAEGRFREDLFYRLNVVHVRVPPLRERPDDIPRLARHFEAEARAMLGSAPPPPPLTDHQLNELTRRPWPGNVRELRNVVTRIVTLGEMADSSAVAAPKAHIVVTSEVNAPLQPAGAEEILTLAEAERRAIVRAMRAAGGIKLEAAKLLDCSRRTLYTKIQQYGLE